LGTCHKRSLEVQDKKSPKREGKDDIDKLQAIKPRSTAAKETVLQHGEPPLILGERRDENKKLKTKKKTETKEADTKKGKKGKPTKGQHVKKSMIWERCRKGACEAERKTRAANMTSRSG